MSGYNALNETILDNEHISDLLAKLQNEKAEYSAREMVQIRHYCYRLFGVHVQAYTAHANGLVTLEYLSGIQQDMVAITQLYPGLVTF
jgi:hypothetical protein